MGFEFCIIFEEINYGVLFDEVLINFVKCVFVNDLCYFVIVVFI